MSTNTTNSSTYAVQPETSPQRKKMDNDRDPLINRCDPIEEEGFFDGILRPCLAEFIAVTFFVFIGTMAAVTTTGSPIGIIVVALSQGFAIALLVVVTGAVSGGHMNPAVTLGVYLSGGIPTLKAVLYVISQLVGAILGASLTRGVVSETIYKAGAGGANHLGPDTSASEGLLCEVVLTCILVTTVLMSAVDPSTKSSNGSLAIGLAVAVDNLAGGSISTACMNPARSFGAAVVVSTYSDSVWDYHYIFWVGPALGALLASVMYRLFLASPERRLFSSCSS